MKPQQKTASCALLRLRFEREKRNNALSLKELRFAVYGRKQRVAHAQRIADELGTDVNELLAEAQRIVDG